ncbi:MAG: cupin domain-containing protein [Halioglobus sp.]|nr:cupin domain-containing protein [Halioglobus sp.]
MRLDYLLGDVGVAEFARRHWDVAPLYIPGDDEKFAQVYSLEAFESDLTETNIRPENVQLTKDGKAVPEGEYLLVDRQTDANLKVINLTATYNHWNAGGTIVLRGLHRKSPTLGRQIRHLQKDVPHPLQVNAYATPPHSQGFGAHYDTHDVFVLQIAGHKRWTIAEESVRPQPLRHDRWFLRDPPPDTDMAQSSGIELTPGDFLYIPRGVMHKAASSDVTSLHLTIGIHNYRNIDFVKEALSRVTEQLESSGDPFWRQSLPLDFAAGGALDYLQDQLPSLTDMVHESLASAVRDTTLNKPSPATNQFVLGNTDRIEAMTDETALESRFGLDDIQLTADDKVRIRCNGKSQVLPRSVDEAVYAMCEQGRFRPADLAGYDVESRNSLCRHLLKEGFIAFGD